MSDFVCLVPAYPVVLRAFSPQRIAHGLPRAVDLSARGGLLER